MLARRRILHNHHPLQVHKFGLLHSTHQPLVQLMRQYQTPPDPEFLKLPWGGVNTYSLHHVGSIYSRCSHLYQNLVFIQRWQGHFYRRQDFGTTWFGDFYRRHHILCFTNHDFNYFHIKSSCIITAQNSNPQEQRTMEWRKLKKNYDNQKSGQLWI